MADETPNPPQNEEPAAQVPAAPEAEQAQAPEQAEPAGEPTSPEPAPEEPVAEASEPTAEHGTEGAVPVEEAPEPATEAAEPATEAAEPVAETPAPVTEPTGAEPDEPVEPRVKPAVPGADLEVDIVLEGMDPLAREAAAAEYDEAAAEGQADEREEPDDTAKPIAVAAIDLAAGARYPATGKRKTAIARVILRPGTGAYDVNGKSLEDHFPRITLQRNIRQPLETVGYEQRMDVVARLHGGGISAQAGALRHGISRALLEADPNLRGELKRRGFLTRDSRAKERKKAGLKKARKRPQFSKR
jgi:small subunit ribosomal protein S9